MLPHRSRTEPRQHSSRFASCAPSLEFACPHDDNSQPYRYRTGPSISPCLFVPGVPPAFDDFIHDRPCEFISPRSRLQDSLFKGFPSYTATMTRRHRFAFVSVHPASLLAVAHQRHLTGRRLQGVAPCRSPLSVRRGLAADLPAPFLSFPPSRFCSLSPSREGFRLRYRPSPYAASVTVIRVTGVQRVENVEPDRSLPGPADLLEVLTCPHELAPARTRQIGRAHV